MASVIAGWPAVWCRPFRLRWTARSLSHGGLEASTFVLSGFGALFEHLPVPDQPLAGVSGQLEILSQLQCIHWAGIFAQPAEHAAGKVVGEVGQLFAAGLLVALAAHHDQGLRTCQRAQVAGDTKGFAVFRVDVEPRSAS